MLFIVATPIGNLEDITLRSLKVLKECDYILCEDTRKSKILLTHYSIDNRLLSFHKFNERRLEEQILKDLETGQNIALISDGGTPLISDPGKNLIIKCIEKKLPFTTLPGPCSIIAALTLSGLSSECFQFVGFLPKKKKALETLIASFSTFDGTSIAFESPYRLLKTLKIAALLDSSKTIVVVREITKKFEEVARGTAAELLDHFDKKGVKGEIVLLFEN